MTIFAGYGISPYGTSALGMPTEMSVGFAFASSIRRVRVRLTSPPRMKTKSVPGDALNPKSWSVTRLDTLESLFVLQVEPVNSTTFDLYTMKKFGDYPIEHEVRAELLFSMGGSEVVAPVSAMFWGVTWIFPTTPDIPFTSDLKYVQPGVFDVDSGGDYSNISELEVLKKVLLRKLTTVPASFFHLPNFGIGLRAKEPFSTTDLLKLKKQIELAALEEPEVLQAVVMMSFSADGILIIKLQVRTSDNQSLEMSSTMQTNYAPLL
jgi:hypothetical protein